MSVPLQRQGTNSKNRRSQYTDTADGRKLRVVQKWNPNYNEAPVAGATATPSLLASSKTTDHIGNKTYENGTLKRILVEGGYIQGGTYYFYQTDHLGNNRVVLDANGGRIEDSHYYPFGMAFGAHASTQPYKYNNKELDQMHGLNQYDYSARYYEPAIGRFTTVDPHAEKYYSISPYAYVANNPLLHIDPTGMDSVKINGQNHDRSGFLFRSLVSFFQIGSRVVEDHSKLIGETTNRALGNENPTFEENLNTTINVYSIMASGYGLSRGVGNNLFSRSGSNSKMRNGNYLKSDPYVGYKSASQYLKSIGVDRSTRKQILNTFDLEIISLRTADYNTYGFRFYGGKASTEGRHLFPTFNNYTTRTGLALEPQ